MSKRFSKVNLSSAAKKQRLDVTRESVVPKEQKPLQNVVTGVEQNCLNDLWGEDFGEDAIEEMDFIASQATQEEVIFATPKPKAESDETLFKHPLDPLPSTSSGFRGINQHNIAQKNNPFDTGAQSQMLGSSEVNKEIFESTQAIMFDDFETNLKNHSHNSTFRNRQDVPNNNVVLVSDDEQIEKWKEEKKKLLEDFMTKEGETEFLRQQLSQIQVRAENTKKEQARILEEQVQKFRAEINNLQKEKTSLESQLQLQNLQFNSVSEKCKLLESGSVKFAQPKVNVVKTNKDKSNSSMQWTPKKVKTKESGVQVKETAPVHLKTDLILYPLKILPQCAFEPAEPEKAVVEIKIEEKIGKSNLAIIQEEENFRIFENPEISKPMVTTVDEKPLSTEFLRKDLADLMNKTSDEINSWDSIPIVNKLVATTRELLLNSILVLKKISQAMQNDDIRDMNEMYLSEFYEMPVLHTKCICQGRAWYELERGVETRRAIGILAYVATASDYLGNYVAGNKKLKTNRDPAYDGYIRQMKSYENWDKKEIDFEFLDLILEFVTVIGIIRRSHQFSGLINAIMTLFVNVQDTVGFSALGLRRIHSIFKEVVFSRPLLICFITMSNLLKEFSEQSSFVSKLCLSPAKSGINYWKGSFSFTLAACPLEIFLAELDYFKLDPITLINITKDLARFSNIALLSNYIPWLEKTKDTCDCCLNLLKFVILNLNECTKINVEKLRDKYLNDDVSWRISKHEVNKKTKKIIWQKQLVEDWKDLEENRQRQFWDDVKAYQYCAISYGIQLLCFLAKRDLDFMIRLSHIEDAFHLFLYNLSQRSDLQLKKNDEISLDIVKKAFVLEKNIEENKSSQFELDIVSLESQNWTDIPTTSLDSVKLYEDAF